MNDHDPLDELSPLNFLAVTLAAEEQRLEQGLPKSAPIVRVLWLCTSKEYRAKDVGRAKRWAYKHVGTLEAAGIAVAKLPEYQIWRDNEEKQLAWREEKVISWCKEAPDE